MPFNPTTPESKNVVTTTESEITLDTYDVLRFDMHFDPNNPIVTYVDVTWLKGYMDDESFVEVERTVTRLAGIEFLQAVGAMADSSKSVYDNVKETLWRFMMDQGLVPEGSIV